jgi:hypothetical protein
VRVLEGRVFGLGVHDALALDDLRRGGHDTGWRVGLDPLGRAGTRLVSTLLRLAEGNAQDAASVEDAVGAEAPTLRMMSRTSSSRSLSVAMSGPRLGVDAYDDVGHCSCPPLQNFAAARQYKARVTKSQRENSRAEKSPESKQRPS